MTKNYTFSPAERFWRELRFSFGLGTQIIFPSEYDGLAIPLTCSHTLDLRLGFELGHAFLKRTRPEPPQPGDVEEGFIAHRDLFCLLRDRIAVNGHRSGLAEGFSSATEKLIDLAMNAPDLLPVVHRRIDGLTGEALQGRIGAILDDYKMLGEYDSYGLPSVFDPGFESSTARALAAARRKAGGRQ